MLPLAVGHTDPVRWPKRPPGVGREGNRDPTMAGEWLLSWRRRASAPGRACLLLLVRALPVTRSRSPHRCPYPAALVEVPAPGYPRAGMLLCQRVALPGTKSPGL